MVEVSNFRIPEFIYLDDQKVDMTLSQIEGSIPVKSRSQTSSGKSKRGGGNVGFQGIIGVHGGLESSSGEEQEETREEEEPLHLDGPVECEVCCQEFSTGSSACFECGILHFQL